MTATSIIRSTRREALEPVQRQRIQRATVGLAGVMSQIGIPQQQDEQHKEEHE